MYKILHVIGGFRNNYSIAPLVAINYYMKSDKLQEEGFSKDFCKDCHNLPVFS